jgi:RNA polymerase sigma-70 factor (ECF subfamily)
MVELSALIERWLSGDERAAEAIYNQYQSSTFGLAYTILGNSADAEEVAQDSLTYALTHLDRYDPQRARFTTWLNTITISRCRNRRRRRFLPSLPLLSWLKGGGDIADPMPGPENLMHREVIRNEIWDAIQTLSEPQREAIILRYWADYSYQEIAQILGCSMRTSQSRVRAAHKRLAAVLAHDDLITLKENS